MDASLADSTKIQYKKVWNEFTLFCSEKLLKSDANLPVSINTLSLFLASLFQKGYAPASICTYNSAISYFHKLHNMQDPASSFFIVKMLHGARKTRPCFDSRLPITRSILQRLISALNHTCSNPYYQAMYKAMFSIAFYGFLRVGEITKNLGNNSSHCLQVSDIHQNTDGFSITFRSYKHSVPGTVSKICVARVTELAYCPVRLLEKYLGLRGNKNGCLFVHPNLLPISRSQFINALNAALSFIGLSTSVYKGHIFRIGASTWALQQGKSDTQIRALGRWKSNAFLKYLRPEIHL